MRSSQVKRTKRLNGLDTVRSWTGRRNATREVWSYAAKQGSSGRDPRTNLQSFQANIFLRSFWTVPVRNSRNPCIVAGRSLHSLPCFLGRNTEASWISRVLHPKSDGASGTPKSNKDDPSDGIVDLSELAAVMDFYEVRCKARMTSGSTSDKFTNGRASPFLAIAWPGKYKTRQMFAKEMGKTLGASEHPRDRS